MSQNKKKIVLAKGILLTHSKIIQSIKVSHNAKLMSYYKCNLQQITEEHADYYIWGIPRQIGYYFHIISLIFLKILETFKRYKFLKNVTFYKKY